MDDESNTRLKATVGGNCAQLAAAEEKYDPADLFRVNQNIEP
jgi:hypothetical protein